MDERTGRDAVRALEHAGDVLNSVRIAIEAHQETMQSIAALLETLVDIEATRDDREREQFNWRVDARKEAK